MSVEAGIAPVVAVSKCIFPLRRGNSSFSLRTMVQVPPIRPKKLCRQTRLPNLKSDAAAHRSVIHMPRRLEIEDLDRFVMASHPQLSPDGGSLAYVVTRVEGEVYVPTLYLVDPGDGSPKKYWERARSPVWSPDGSQLAFVSNRGLKEGEKGAEIWVTTLCGEPRLVCKAPGGVEQPAWSGNGRSIYFLSYVGEEPKDARVIDHIPFWYDGVGWTHYRRKHLHVVDVASGMVKQLTEGESDVVCHAPSNKGERVAYAVSETESGPARDRPLCARSGEG